MQIIKTLEQRILDNIKKDANGCWLWQGYVAPNGYGSIYIGSYTDGSRRNTMVHRTSYEVFTGQIPKGLHIDHLCKVRNCVNPEHLEAVTPKENVHRSNAKYKQQMLRTHCPQNHEYTLENTYSSRSRAGGVSRSCKTCDYARHRKRYAERKALV